MGRLHKGRIVQGAAALLGGISLMLTMSGCITLGRPFTSHRVAAIVVGQTTQAEVQKLFGDPYRTGIENGDTTWTYVHYRLGVFGEQRTTDLYVRFNPDGTVKSYAFNTNVPEEQPK